MPNSAAMSSFSVPQAWPQFLKMSRSGFLNEAEPLGIGISLNRDHVAGQISGS